jgi:acetyltransferase-like isoleucine patch superfamily enzyme
MLSQMSHLWCKFTKIARGRSLRHSHVHRNSKVIAGSTLVNSSFDRHSYCGYDCVILNAEIGSFVSIASRVTVGGMAHPMHFVSMSPVFLSHKDSLKTKFARFDYLPNTRTVIGSDVWIGDGAYIKAGTRIGNGAVIGMGAVVTKDVPEYAIVAGNPARIVRYRFDEAIRSALSASKWWTLDDRALAGIARHIADPAAFIDAITKS